MGYYPRPFGAYELLEEIGRGSHGIVYRAKGPDRSVIVALKRLRFDDVSAETVERFRREGRILTRLRHPDLVEVIDLGEAEGVPFMTLRLVPGVPLSDVLAAGRFDVVWMAGLLARVARALHHAHRHGVVHRDLKPANVLVRAGGRPVVIDFGCAHETGVGGELTRDGALLGTPTYMPPEQICGRIREIDARTDVYSLGAILYFALTGRPPFEGESLVELSGRILNDAPEPPSRINPAVDPGLEHISLRCLSKDRGGRYPAADALAMDLELSAEAHEEARLKPVHSALHPMTG